MNVIVSGPRGKESVHLKQVAYIEGFHTSLASMHLLEEAGDVWSSDDGSIQQETNLPLKQADMWLLSRALEGNKSHVD